MLRHHLCRVVLGGLLLASPTLAAVEETKMVDVRDLLIAIPDYESTPVFRLEPSATLKAAAVAPAPQPSRAETVGTLESAIRDAMPTTSADAARVAVGADGKLTITSDAAGLAAADRLLAALRGARGRQVMLQVKLVELTDAKLATLPDDLRSRVVAARLTGLAADVSADEVKAVLATASTTLAAPRLTEFDGQRAFVSVSTDTAFVREFKAVKAADGTPGAEPVIDVCPSGVTLDARPSLAADGATVALSLRLEATALLRIDSIQQPNGAIQRPHTVSDVVDAQCVVPNGGTVLLARTRRTATAVGDAAKKAPVLVFVTATTIVNGAAALGAPAGGDRLAAK